MVILEFEQTLFDQKHHKKVLLLNGNVIIIVETFGLVKCKWMKHIRIYQKREKKRGRHTNSLIVSVNNLWKAIYSLLNQLWCFSTSNKSDYEPTIEAILTMFGLISQDLWPVVKRREKVTIYTGPSHHTESSAAQQGLFVHSQDHFSQSSHSLPFSRLAKKRLVATERSGILGAQWRQDVRWEFFERKQVLKENQAFSLSVAHSLSASNIRFVERKARGALRTHQSPAGWWQTRVRAKKPSKAQLLPPSRTHSAPLLMLFRFSWCSSAKQICANWMRMRQGGGATKILDIRIPLMT